MTRILVTPLWLVQLLAVARKEIRQTTRDRRLVALLLVAPAVQLGVFGLAVDFEVDQVPTVIVDHDRTAPSRAFVHELLADGTLVRHGDTNDDREALRLIDSGEASAAVFIENGFSAHLASPRPATVQVVVDGTDPNRSSVASATVTRFARAEGAGLVNQVGGRSPTPRSDARALRMLPRVLHNPELSTSTYMVPGILALLLLIITMIVMAMGLTRERETGTLEQVMVTPISASMLMLGKLLPYVIIGLVDLLLGIVVAVHGFEVPIDGNLMVVLAGTATYLCCTLGLGLLISTVSRTQQQAYITGFLVMLPAVLLSGVMTPLWGVPDALMPLTFINPVRYYVEIVRGVLLKGATLVDLSGHFAALSVMAVVFVAVAARRFTRSLA
jgi:ABC-2 type transport system permease protein